MKIKRLSIACALLSATALAPGMADAAFVLDTGTPINTSSSLTVLSTSQWVAAEFAVTATGLDFTQASAYLLQGSGSLNDTFTLDIYSNTSFIGRASSRAAPLYTTTGTFTGNGWNNVAMNWTPTATGDYWVALQVSSTTQTKGLDVAGAGITTSTGTAPTLGFALATGATPAYAAESATAPAAPLGIQLSATPVPLPAAAWLLGSGLAGLGAMRRSRRTAALVAGH